MNPFRLSRSKRWPVLTPLIGCIVLAIFGRALAMDESNHATVIVVVGAPGEPEYRTNFLRQAQLWQTAAQKADARYLSVGGAPPDGTNDVDRLESILAEQPRTGNEALWLVLVGHGTFDGQEARFNLRGPDLSTRSLAFWLDGFQRPLVIIDTSASSAPFLNALSASNRVVITATRSGDELNFTRFGQFLAEAIADPASDLDQDGQTSVLEAFLTAAGRVREYYQSDQRLMTEHALIDDNGDQKGTPAEWFRGTRVNRKTSDNGLPDGSQANHVCLVYSPFERQWLPDLRKERDVLELDLARLRESKDTYPSPDYESRLEALLVKLASVYEQQEHRLRAKE